MSKGIIKELAADVAFCTIVILVAVAYLKSTPPQMSAEFDAAADATRQFVEAGGDYNE